ncbi:MAG: hypothetical protein ACRC57_14375 [Sarcina sp.]
MNKDNVGYGYLVLTIFAMIVNVASYFGILPTYIFKLTDNVVLILLILIIIKASRGKKDKLMTILSSICTLGFIATAGLVLLK